MFKIQMNGKASNQEYFAEVIMVTFWLKLGEGHLKEKNGESDNVDYEEIRNFICEGPFLIMFKAE
jgi:hypothetical protein